MLKRIGALALALAAGAAFLPAAAQAQECYRPHGVAVYGYGRPPVAVYGAPFYRPPVVEYRAPAFGVYVGPAGWRGRDWRGHEWRGRDRRYGYYR
jgi:hypothetical protein